MELAEAILSLFDFCWFEQEIFTKMAHTATSPSIVHQDHEIMERSSSSGSSTAEIARVPSILLRSMSDQMSSQASFLLESPSPNSVLRSPARLHPVQSGKEISEEEVLSVFEKQGTRTRAVNSEQNRGKDDRRRERRRKMALSKSSKSLTDLELEFEELQGFMDLGFVFTEEDKDSSLASIIPGLQRLGKKFKEEKGGEERSRGETYEKFHESDEKDSPSLISRPYLSETWEWLDRRKKEERPLVNWNFPALSNETDMKDNLRWWAHAVASTVG